MSEIQVTTATLIKALALCNESRNRLTGFKSTPDFWILEAHAALAKSEDALASHESGGQNR